MSLISINGQTSDHDLAVQRKASGTIGGDHITPASLGGTTINQVITPFDPRVAYHGTWTIQDGASIVDFLGYDSFTTAPGSNVIVNFTGTSIAVVGSDLQSGGRVDAYIDGALTNGIVNTVTTLGASYFIQSGRALNDTDTTVTVSSTSSFSSSGIIQIDQEQISYTGTTGSSFTGCVRGANNTVATSHFGGISVYQCTSLIETYAQFDQARIILWRNNSLSNGPHTLQLVLRSDKNASSSGTQLTIDGFVLGGLVGAQNVNTNIRYINITNFNTDGSGLTGPIVITPDTTGSQLIGILGAYPVSGCTWCYPMWNPASQTVVLVTSALSSTISAVLSCTYLGPTF